jgi:ribonuclease HI
MESSPFARVAAHAHKWQQIGASPTLIRMIKYGVLLPWTGQPRHGIRREYPLLPEDYRFAFNEMDRWIAEGFAEEISEAEARKVGLVVSGFVVHGSKPRVVIDYTTQNEVLGSRKFRMDTLADLAPQLKPGDVLFKADVQDAYYHLRLRRCDRDKLLFRIAGRFFRPLALNCGLSAAPWLFTKFLRPVVQELRRQGHRLISYLDDLSGAPRTDCPDTPSTPADAERAGREIRRLFTELGLSLHPTKTDFSGKQALELLGIVVDTRRQLYLLSPEKLRKIASAARLFRQSCIRRKRRCSLRDLQRFCGLANSANLAVTDARLYLRALFNCSSAATSSRQVTLCHQSLRDLTWWSNLPTNIHVGRAIWDVTPSATLVTDASMEGWGAVMHSHGKREVSLQLTPTSTTNTSLLQNLGASVPARGLFIPTDAEPVSINQRELLAAILGLSTFLQVARSLHVNLLSDSQVSLAVVRNWTSRSPRLMALLRILRRLCEENGISLGLQYIPSVLNIWADKLSRCRDSSDWAITPFALAQIQGHLSRPILSQVFARRDTVIPNVSNFYSPNGTGMHDPAGHSLPAFDGQTPWPSSMGLTLVTPTPAQAGLVLRHLLHAPSDAAVVIPDWPAQPWHQPSLHAASTTIQLVGPVWHRARHTERNPYYEQSEWSGRLLVFHRRPPPNSIDMDTLQD